MLKAPTSQVDTVPLNLLPPTHFEGEDEVEQATQEFPLSEDCLFLILTATDVNFDL